MNLRIAAVHYSPSSSAGVGPLSDTGVGNGASINVQCVITDVPGVSQESEKPSKKHSGNVAVTLFFRRKNKIPAGFFIFTWYTIVVRLYYNITIKQATTATPNKAVSFLTLLIKTSRHHGKESDISHLEKKISTGESCEHKTRQMPTETKNGVNIVCIYIAFLWWREVKGQKGLPGNVNFACFLLDR